MGLFSRKTKVAPAPGPVIAKLPKETVKKLNDAGPAETNALILKYHAALRGVATERLNGLLEYAKEIETASVGGTVVALRIHKGKKMVVLPAGKASLFSATGSGRHTRRNRRGRKIRGGDDEEEPEEEEAEEEEPEEEEEEEEEVEAEAEEEEEAEGGSRRRVKKQTRRTKRNRRNLKGKKLRKLATRRR